MDNVIRFFIAVILCVFPYLCVLRALPIIKARRFNTLHLLIAFTAAAVWLALCVSVVRWAP